MTQNTIETSIVIPTYNADKTLYRLLQSIFESDYSKDKLEVIVVDNNSKDDSKLVALKFPVKYILETSQGRSHARNRGIKEAKGKFVAFLDADTYIEKDWIDQMVKHLSPDFIGGGQGQIIPSNVDRRSSLNTYRFRSVEADTEGSFSILDLQYDESPMINSAACMYKKEALDRVGGFDLKLERHEDIDLAKRVLYSGYDLFSVTEAIAHVVFHGGGWGSYMTRWFWDGYYKGDYIKKWSTHLELKTDTTDEEAPEIRGRDQISKHLYKAGKHSSVTDGDPFSETIDYEDKDIFGKEALNDNDFENIVRDLPFDPRSL